MKNLYEEVKKIVKRRDLTIQTLADKVGMSRVGLAYSLKNRTVKPDVIGKLSKALGVPTNFFMEDTSSVVNEAPENYAKAIKGNNYQNIGWDDCIRQLSSKDELITSLKQQIQDKEEIIKLLKKS
jgi:transcriptional regulator with XRE-family HTH domain